MSQTKGVLLRGLKILVGYVRTHPGPFATAIAGATVFAIGTVGSAVVLGRITDTVIDPAFHGGVETRTLVLGLIAVVAVALLRAGGAAARRYFAGMTGFRVQRTLRTQIADKYRDLPVAYHRGHPTGELLAHAEADVLAATEVLNPLPFSIAAVVLVVVAIVVLIATDPVLAIVGLALWPLLAVLNRMFGRVVEPPASRAQKKIGDVSGVVHESVDGALVVKTLGREEAEVNRLAAEAEQLRKERVRMGELRAMFEPAFEALPGLGIVGILALGAWRVSTGAVTFGTLVQFVSLFQLLTLPMRLIGWFIMDLPRCVVGYTRLKEVLETPVKVTGSRDPEPWPDGPLGIAATDVVYGYDGYTVLDGVSFRVEPNESVALVGPTGSGKSTLAQLLVRLDDPDSGSIRAGGIDLRCAVPDEIQRDIAVVFQESFLFATTLRENIALGLDIDDDDIEAAARLARAHDFITALPEGYDSVVGERGVTLSGGQRQRVALARALVRKPRVLILDDATSSVDPRIEAEILDSLRNELDTTLLVIAYRVSTIRLAQRVLFLNDGRIVADGAHDELMEVPGYEAMVRAYERSAA